MLQGRREKGEKMGIFCGRKKGYGGPSYERGLWLEVTVCSLNQGLRPGESLETAVWTLNQLVVEELVVRETDAPSL